MAAQIRLADHKEALRKNKAADLALKAAKAAYETCCHVLEDELETLYDDVQKDFSTFYREINQEDEATFKVRGALGLEHR